jgi:hypothetical protein
MVGSVDIRAALLNEMHKTIDTAATDALGIVDTRAIELAYPPGIELSAAEVSALANIPSSPELRSALHKVFREVASRPLFHFFALIDGVADPTGWNGLWLGARVVEPPDDADQEMWHDEFFASYWQYAKPNAPDV